MTDPTTEAPPGVIGLLTITATAEVIKAEDIVTEETP